MASIFSGLIGRLGAGRQPAKADAAIEKPIAAMAASYQFGMPDFSLPKSQADLYRRLSWVYSAVNITATFAASTPLSVKRMVGEDEEDVPNHDFEKLLLRPNPMQSRHEFLEMSFSSLKLTGNCYWWLNRPSGGIPSEIWIIPSWMIRPIPDGRMYIRGYEYDTGYSETLVLPTDAIVHTKTVNPLNPYVGMSAIEALAVTAVGDMKMLQWNANFFGKDNTKIPGALAFHDTVTRSDWERLREEIKSQWGGANRSGPLMLNGVGAGGVNWVQMGVSQKDMEFLSGRAFNREEIYAVLAPGLASMLAINATEANSRTGKATFVDFCVYPLQCLLAEKITNDIMPLYGDDYKAEFDDIRATDRVIELQEIEMYLRTHTIDETRREYYGDEPLAAGAGVRVAGADAAPAAAQVVSAPAVRDAQAEPEDDDEVAAEMKKWKRKAMRAIEAGKSADVPFVTDVIPDDVASSIRDKLAMAKSEDDVRRAFARDDAAKKSKIVPVADNITALLDEIRRANDLWAQEVAAAKSAGELQPQPQVLQLPEEFVSALMALAAKEPVYNIAMPEMPAPIVHVAMPERSDQAQPARELIPVYGNDGKVKRIISRIKED